ncbi:hypothetical protein G7Y89_g6549 [Cudoniella acicularis]|uniref:C2H2-type domain-containing protein n=1 Tax=Cudoniella acicularis TaxID=354080 RepID=A0A8H4RMF8_9HELO|nr:hypothetical protein G7Y89_g6549 [Cudoniella acicularis]
MSFHQPTAVSTDAKLCRSHLEKICDNLRAITISEADIIGIDRNATLLHFQDSHARFKAWGVSIAAFRGELHPMSLDFRLRYAPDIRERLCKVLGELREYLEDCERANQIWEEDSMSDSDSDGGPKKPLYKGKAPQCDEVKSTSELQELCTAINASILNLMKLSVLIRESSKRDDYAKAASRYSTWNPGADIGHMREKHGTAKWSNDWILKRLGKAITRRRQFLTYRKEHYGKLTGDWGEDIETIQETIPKDVEAAKTIAPTQATTFVPNLFQPERDGSDVAGFFGSQTSYEATEFANTDGPTKLAVPSPPKWAFEDVPFEYGEPFQCPLCYTEQVVKNKNAWKKHVFRDLKPYVCTFQGCSMRMFRSRNEWFAHELQSHRREWVCQFCQHKPFSTAELFSDHVASAHPAILAGSKIGAVILQSEEPIVRISGDACPLCDEWNTRLHDSKHDTRRLLLNDGNVVEPYGTPKQFRRHLGRHMEQLALFALPVKESGELDDDNQEEQENDVDSDDQQDIPLEPEHEIVEELKSAENLDGYLLDSDDQEDMPPGSGGEVPDETILSSDDIVLPPSQRKPLKNSQNPNDDEDSSDWESDLDELGKQCIEIFKTREDYAQTKQFLSDDPDYEENMKRFKSIEQEYEVLMKQNRKKDNREAREVKDEEIGSGSKDKRPEPPKDLEKEMRKPIRFKDAVGRKFSFPFHLCATWTGMEELIKQAFLHVDVIGPRVQDGNYDLVGPNGEIILPDVWDIIIEPGWEITMYMWALPEPHISGPPRPGPPPGHVFEERSTPESLNHPGQQQQNDRPFKCDQCSQYFDRNHDLKRHKRIHLAVKPFPCQYCEKSFSRKDALKYVERNDGSQSPVSKSEVISNSTDDYSPKIANLDAKETAAEAEGATRPHESSRYYVAPQSEMDSGTYHEPDYFSRELYAILDQVPISAIFENTRTSRGGL